jgi:hypothetical protein
MQKLTDVLQASVQFTDPTVDDYVLLDKQAVFMKLAENYQMFISHLYEDPEELVESTGIGTGELWEEFINLEPVRFYTSVRTKKLAEVDARKSLKNLQKSANKGDVSAIKYLNEVSGILQSQGDGKQIVLHFVPRPKNAPKGLKSDGK